MPAGAVLAMALSISLGAMSQDAWGCPERLSSAELAGVTDRQIRDSALATDIPSAIRSAGSAVAAVKMTEAQIREYERYQRELSQSRGPEVSTAADSTHQAILVNRAFLNAFRCYAERERPGGGYSDASIKNLQDVASDLMGRLAQLQQEPWSEPTDSGGDALARRDAWLRERDHARRLLDEQLATVAALLRDATGTSFDRSLDSLLDDLVSGGSGPGASRDGGTPAGKSRDPEPSRHCRVSLSAAPAGTGPQVLGHDPLRKSWMISIPADIVADCGAANMVLRVAYRDGGERREIRQRPRVGLGFDRGLLFVELIATAPPRLEGVTAEEIGCSCDGAELPAAQPVQVIYRQSQLDSQAAREEAARKRQLDEEARAAAARCPSVATLSGDERRLLCEDQSQVRRNLQAAWHRAAVQLLHFGELLDDVRQLEDELALTFEADRDLARRRVAFANATNKLEAALSLLSPLGAGSSIRRSLESCTPPLKLSAGVGTSDIRNHLNDLRSAIDFAASPSLAAYLESVGWCVAGEWSPLLGKAKEVVTLVSQDSNDHIFETQMALYREEVIRQIVNLRRARGNAERKVAELRLVMETLSGWMEEVSQCACS
jgi:hypothetical protein